MLATKYRPTKLSDVVGQALITGTLTKELETSTTKQSYLFAGKSGSGKTTTARILANELDGNTIEIDAASNNSAESMRNLIESAKTKPITKSKNIVIIDEAHSLSQNAVQVLLKSIEEPPKHLMFILCTTELQKIPQTIQNRCECFDFTPIADTEITNRLKEIAIIEKLPFDVKALNQIAKLSDGSMRQAITYMEQCIPNGLTLQTVKETIMNGSLDTYMDIIYEVCDKDYESIVETLQNITNVEKFIENFFTFLLDVEIYAQTHDEEYVKLPQEYLADIKSNIKPKDKKMVKALRNAMIELQYKGRNNPLLKELFMAVLFKVIEQ